MRIQLITAVMVSATAIATPAQALPADFKARADALLAKSYAADGPGAQVVVSERGRVLYRGARGMADVDSKRPIDETTVFRIGSITKQFAAAVVLQMAAEGKLKLDDPIARFLPSYPNGAAITVQQLLNHTSGIQSYTGIPGWMVESKTNKAYSTTALIAEFKDMPAVTSPGETFAYNNSGYVLLGALIEAISGRPWHEEVERRLTKPLGLTSLRYGVGEASVATMAKGHTDFGGTVIPSRLIHMSVPGAAGALIGSAGDLAKWHDALHHGKVVPAPYYARMIAPTVLPDGKTEQYGFGIAPGTLRDVPVVGHGGGIFGFSSDSVYVPSADVSVTVLTNSDSPPVDTSLVMSRLAAMAIGKPFEEFTAQPLDAASVMPALGRYQFATAERVLTLVDGKLYAQRVGGSRLPVLSAGKGRYFYGSADLSWFELAADPAGKPVMKFYANGSEKAEAGKYLGPPPVEAAAVTVPAAMLAAYVGTYSTPAGKAAVTSDAGPLMIQLRGSALPMKAVSLAEFTVDQVAAKVRFVSTAGKVTGIEIEQGGRTLPGTRD